MMLLFKNNCNIIIILDIEKQVASVVVGKGEKEERRREEDMS